MKKTTKLLLFTVLGVIIVLSLIYVVARSGSLNSRDLSGFSAGIVSAEEIVKEVNKEAKCTCGCGLTIEGCEKYDPTCTVRPKITAQIEDLAEQGKSKEDILNILNGKQGIDQGAGDEIFISIDNDPVKGSASAPVTVIEFSDFQCPFCARFYSDTLSQIEEEFISTGKVRFIYRDYPLSFHSYAQKSAEAAECADQQGKFWQYHDLLFERQGQWSVKGTDELKKYAGELGLDIGKFNKCLDNGEMASEVKKDFSDGQSYGVTGTPAFFINGELVSGAMPFSVFKQKIEAALNNS